jgi:hypothetical protein
MEAGYNVNWFRCPDCKPGPTTLAKALNFNNWECDDLDDQSGRTTHNDNKKKRHQACPQVDDFKNELRAGDMHPRDLSKVTFSGTKTTVFEV